MENIASRAYDAGLRPDLMSRPASRCGSARKAVPAGEREADLRVSLSMPQFFLHLHNGMGLVRDEEGSELPDLQAAREKAISGIRSILSDEVRTGRLSLAGRVEIVDAEGRSLAVIAFAEAIELDLGEAR